MLNISVKCHEKPKS